jgi:hypothetical protein
MANQFDKNKTQDSEQKQEQGQHNPSHQDPQDANKKNPSTEEFPEHKDQDGSKDVEKRRAS